MPNVYEPLVLEIEPPYIGSAVSPTVDIDETADDITVTITDSRGEHSYTVDKTDDAIADAEAAAANANQAAQDVQSAVDAASTAATSANESADAADDAASDARAATVDTEAATQAANIATSNANAATSTATTAAQNADAKAALANTAASNADAKAALANTAAANADAKAALADNAATSATTAAGQASTAAGNANDAATAANTAADAADAAREAIQDDLAAKADKDGYYQLLAAGMADALPTGDATVDTFTQRVSDHDGGVYIESLRGNTIVESGELVSVNIEGIESAGVVREIPVATYFSTGMHGVGNTYDELKQDKAVNRMAELTIESDNITNAEVRTHTTVVECSTPNSSVFVSGYTSRDFITSVAGLTWNPRFQDIPENASTWYVATKGYPVFLFPSSVTAEQARVLVTGAKVVGPARNGEVVTPIDPPLNMAYPTEEGGTESIIVPTGEMSAAPTMAVVYAYNADGVRDISQAIIANIEGATASTNYSVGGYFVHAGKLYRATSAIATGETINPGTNCTQTTVMAELLALTA